MGRPASQNNAGDLRTTAPAILTGSRVDAVLVLISAGRAIDIDVVAQRAAAMADGASQDHLDCAIQPFDLRGVESISGGHRMDLGVEKCFIGINVSHSGEE